METVPLERVDPWTPIEISLHGLKAGATAAFAVPRALVVDLVRELRESGPRDARCVGLPFRGAAARNLPNGSVIELNCVDMLVVVRIRNVPRRCLEINASSEVRCARREMTGRVGWRMVYPFSSVRAEDALIGTVPGPGQPYADAGVLVKQLARAFYHAAPVPISWAIGLTMSIRFVAWLNMLEQRPRRLLPAMFNHLAIRTQLNVHQSMCRETSWVCGDMVSLSITRFEEFVAVVSAVAGYCVRFRMPLTMNEDMSAEDAMADVQAQCARLRFPWE